MKGELETVNGLTRFSAENKQQLLTRMPMVCDHFSSGPAVIYRYQTARSFKLFLQMFPVWKHENRTFPCQSPCSRKNC